MRKILDTIRRNEAQLGVMQHKTLPHIKDVGKRIRISNCAMVTRVDQLEHVYHDCATLMQEMRKTLESMCQQQQQQQQQHDRSPSPLRRNHVSQSQQHKEEDDDITTTTTTIIDPEANADRGDARNDTSSTVTNNSKKKEHGEDHHPLPWNTTTRVHPNHATTTMNPTRASFHLEPQRRPETIKDLHQHPLLTELLRFDNNNNTTK